MDNIRTNEIPKGTIVQLTNGWLVETDAMFGEYHDEFVPVNKVNIKGELIDHEHSSPDSSARDFLKKRLGMPNDSFAYIPSFDMSYAFIKEDGVLKRIPVYLTEDQKRKSAKFNKYRELGENEYETD